MRRRNGYTFIRGLIFHVNDNIYGRGIVSDVCGWAVIIGARGAGVRS